MAFIRTKVLVVHEEPIDVGAGEMTVGQMVDRMVQAELAEGHVLHSVEVDLSGEPAESLRASYGGGEPVADHGPGRARRAR